MRQCLLVLTVLALLAPALARAHPTSREASRWRPPGWWLAQARCIHRHESVDWHRSGVDWAGRSSPYYGGMQFLVSTWRSAGGAGVPSQWSPREQLYRAFVIWRRDGGSWSEWGTATGCGLT